MALIKKNIWTLFIIIFSFATLLFITLSYLQWKEINRDYRVQNENFTKLISKTTHSYFEQVDTLLLLLGKQLLENDNYKDKQKAKELFNEMFGLNKTINGYALIAPNGKFILSGTSTNPEKIPGLLDREESKQTFLDALKTDKMQIGRTYYFSIINENSIPIRKTFFDKEGNPIAMASIGIPVENSSLFDKDILNNYSHVIHLFRDNDRYRQLYIYKTEDEKIEDIYNKPLSQKAYNMIINSLEKSYKKDISEIKENEELVSFKFHNEVNNHEYLISSKYMKKYQLWANSYVRYDEIETKYAKTFFIYFAVYILGLIIISWLFKIIANAEERKRMELEYRASHDELTDLPNRYYLRKHIQSWTDKKTFSLIYIDLDNFKYINDTLGHRFGDEVLKALTIKIKESIFKNDLLVRQGGDEFLIFTNEVLDIKSFSEQLIELFNKPLIVQGSQIVVNASIGVANFPNDSEEIDGLIICSDIACYEAKKSRNTYKIFKDELKTKHQETMLIEKELKQALEKNEIYLVYQPQINYDNSIHGVETLVRWQNKTLGNVRPDKFIEIAETIGLMPKIGKFIIETAFKQMKELQDKTNRSFQVSINISVTQFMEKDFLDDLMSKIKKYKINPKLITLEITESVLINNIDYMSYLMSMLRSNGFTISLDDFGTGYSSLSMLRSVPINELKIDKAFVDDITNDETAQHLIKSIINIGKVLKYHIVLAEGVETKKQVELLNEFGCSTYQGYYYSKPLSIDDLEAFLEEK